MKTDKTNQPIYPIENQTELENIKRLKIPFFVMYYNTRTEESSKKIIEDLYREYSTKARFYECNMSTITGRTEIWNYELTSISPPVLILYKGEIKSNIFTKLKTPEDIKYIMSISEKNLNQQLSVSAKVNAIEELILNMGIALPALSFRSGPLNSILELLKKEKEYNLNKLKP